MLLAFNLPNNRNLALSKAFDVENYHLASWQFSLSQKIWQCNLEFALIFKKELFLRFALGIAEAKYILVTTVCVSVCLSV